jgi:4-diphosphocytidyl-2-C-methyl-D-erythritol kinase
MQFIEIKARAKINLSLDVLRKRPDGYHDVEMIMQTVKLHDTVRIDVIPSGIELSCKSRYVPSGADNIAYKAAHLLLGKYNTGKGVKIRIEKKIPVAAGLAGGSSDAAAVLTGLCKLFSITIDQGELMALGRQIGADVPFCIQGGTMLAQGIGDELSRLGDLPRTNIVLVKPHIGVSTPWVYQNLRLENIHKHPDTKLLTDCISRGDSKSVAFNMCNVLETVTAEKYSIINQLKSKLVDHGALGSMMSGSGPSVFGIFPDRSSAEKACEKMKDARLDCMVTETFNGER